MPGIRDFRSIATLSVALCHLVHIAGIAKPDLFGFIAEDFRRGVHLFFVLSGFSLMHSTEHTMNRPGWVREYFIKWFFRIAPLFYAVLACMVLWPFVQWHAWRVDLSTVLLNVAFMFGFAPWSGIVWAGWTVGVEMLFYAILPVLLLAVRTKMASLVLVFITIAISLSSYSILYVHFEQSAEKPDRNWAYFSFLPDLCFFAFGIFAFRLAHEIQPTSATMRWLIPAFSVVMFSSLIRVRHGRAFVDLGRFNIVLWGIRFAALCVWQEKWANRWSANRIFEYIGERGFSVYLLQPILFYMLKDRLQSTCANLSAGGSLCLFCVCGGGIDSAIGAVGNHVSLDRDTRDTSRAGNDPAIEIRSAFAGLNAAAANERPPKGGPLDRGAGCSASRYRDSHRLSSGARIAKTHHAFLTGL